MTEVHATETQRRLLIGFYTNEEHAGRALQKLTEEDFPLDRVSLLGKTNPSGDDPLGIYYSTTGDRIRGWGRLGAVWGGVLGMLGGAVGIFMIPGIGMMLIIGPIIEVLAGAVVGAGLGGGVLAGSAALSDVAVAAHRMGVPEASIEAMEIRLRKNQYLLMLIVHRDEVEQWDKIVQSTLPEEQWTFPYVGVSEAIANYVKA